MGSMHTGLEETVTAKGLTDMAAFYEERAKGNVGLIVTGGVAPNERGVVVTGAAKMSTAAEAEIHKVATAAVHAHNGRIAMQILHTGRYANTSNPVSASAIQSPITAHAPSALSDQEVRSTIDDFVKCAEYARSAGYDGVEIMGSEGYLINQFIATKTNKRSDAWGGSYDNRIKFAVEIVRRVRQALGKDFIIIYRLSMLDLISGGSTWDEVVLLAKQIEAAGASIINTGVGWHEARIPTIATMVPRAAFTWVTKRMRGEVGIPLCTSNRINSPEVANQVIAEGHADLVSMARPFLADPAFVTKAMEGRSDEINTCIGCNQACLDHIFVGKRASCLVNPIAGYENSLKIKPVEEGKKRRIAVVGAGPAGLAFASTAAERGHHVELYEREPAVGGQFNMAKRIPGKEEFHETIRYFSKRLEKTGVVLHLNTTATQAVLSSGSFDAVVIATGVTPRSIELPQRGSAVKVLSYLDVLKRGAAVGSRVAVIGAGGIGFDMAEFLTHPQSSTASFPLATAIDPAAISSYLETWGIDKAITAGGVTVPRPRPPARSVFLLQRKAGKLGASLGKTTGWIHRTAIKMNGVQELEGCRYVEVNDAGLVVERDGVQSLLEVDSVVICAGQDPLRELFEQLTEATAPNPRTPQVFQIGGAQEAGELDAKRAIDQGVRLAAVVEDAVTGDVFGAPSRRMKH